MIIICNKRTSKKKAIDYIVKRYKNTDPDANEDSAKRFEKEWVSIQKDETITDIEKNQNWMKYKRDFIRRWKI